MGKRNDFILTDVLYESGDIVVATAQRVSTGQTVILKSIRSNRPSLELLASLRNEYQINHELNLPRLVHCQELVDEVDGHFLIFDETKGVTLKKYLKANPLSLDYFFPIALEMVSGLEDLHNNKVIHKDVKPENILISPDTLAIKYLDLSLASQLSVENQELVSIDKLEGSLPYMSPEQTGRMNRSIDYRSDYYSLGVTFYEMLTGVPPFISVDPLEYVHFHLAMQAKFISDVNPLVPIMVSKIVHKLMSKSADARYQSAQGLRADLESCFVAWTKDYSVPDFELGEFEVLDHLVVSSKIYGRDAEVEQLQNAFEQVVKGGRECLMISGYSGAGKTTLINEIKRPINSVSISGKFDQLQRTTPYTAFSTAFSKLVENWLTESEDKLNRRRNKFLEVFGQSAQVIIDIFPELELLLGKQPEIEALPPEQARNRFFSYFQRFIQNISSKEEPLIIFIDDLQWIDQGSLRLLELLLTTSDVNSLLFLGAYRNNEVDEAHPLIKLLNRIQKTDYPIQEVRVDPLNLEHTQQFLADTLKMDLKAIVPIADAIFKKTAGNPFFTKEFLNECYSNGSLVFSHKEKHWRWDIEKISNLTGSSNVIDLMVGKIQKMPELSQKILQLGSCIGMNFEGATLSSLDNLSELEILEGFSPVMKEGLLQKVEGGLAYKFIHDRVQQAAYQMVTEEEKTLYHLKIGRLLLSNLNEHSENNFIFTVMDQFKRCSALIETDIEKKILADIALMAGKTAITSNAYQAAYEYLNLALLWIKELSQDVDYQLIWKIKIEFIECLYLKGELETAQSLSQSLLIESKGEMDKAYVYNKMLKINLARGDYEAVWSLNHNSAALFGIKIPINPSKISYLFKYYKMRLFYGKKETLAKNVMKIKSLNDEKYTLINTNLTLGAYAVLFKGDQRSMDVSVMNFTEYGLKNAACDEHVFQLLDAWGRIAFTINNDLEEYEILHKYTVEWFNTHNFSSTYKAFAKVRLTRASGFFINIRDMLTPIEEASQVLIEAWSLTYITWSLNTELELFYFADTPLEEMKKKAEVYLKTGNKMQVKSLIEVAQLAVLSVDQLMGNESVSNDAIVDAIPGAGINFGLFSAFNCYFSGEYDRAKQLADMCLKEKKWANLSITNNFFYAFYIMVLAELFPKTEQSERVKIIEQVKKYVQILQIVSKRNPDNFLHLYQLAQAELALMENDATKAHELYLASVEQSELKGFIRWTAIAFERSARLYLKAGNSRIAGYLFDEAIYYYENWGCGLKVSQLKKEFAHLVSSINRRGRIQSGKISSTTVVSAGDLDLQSMIKSNQAISSEIKLEKLLPRILKIVIEAAGAEKAVFIGLRKNSWTVEAIAAVKNNDFDIQTVNAPLLHYENIPESLITYAIRTGESEVIGDIVSDERYARLPYVIFNKPKSVLCLPIKRDDKVTGVLYLENNLTTKAFTTQRLLILQALSTQISISIENARNFEYTQELFHSTERFVPKKFLELLGRKNIEEVQIGDSSKVEMSAIFADLRDFTTLSESIEPEELTYILNTYLKYMAPIIRANNGFINRVLGDGILALFPSESQDAVKAALEMQNALNKFNNEINDAGFNSVYMGVGVNTGAAMLCALGEEERIEANVVSDMVNAASRIEGLNKIYGTKLLISDATYKQLRNKGAFLIRKIDTIKVKGKAKPIDIYEVFNEEKNKEIDAYFSEFSGALELYKNGSFGDAKILFEKCLTSMPLDTVAKIFVERCTALEQTKISENWDGITTMLDK